MAHWYADIKWPEQYKLWARSHKAMLILLEVAAGLVIVAGIGLAIFLWQLARGDISIGFLTTPIEQAINARVKDYRVSIADTVLEWTGEGGIALRLKTLHLQDQSGTIVARAPKAEVGIRLLPLLTGQVVARRLDLIGPKVSVIYDAQGRIAVQLDAPEEDAPGAAGRALELRGNTAPAKEPTPSPAADSAAAAPADDGLGDTAGQMIAFLKAALAGENGTALAGLDQIGVRGVTATFIHERLARRWEIAGGSVVLKRRGDGLEIAASAGVLYRDRHVSMRAGAVVRPTEQGIEVAGDIHDLNPRVLAQSVESLEALEPFDLPVSTMFAAAFADDGTLNTASVTALFGAGHIRAEGIPAEGILIDEAKVRADYDAASRIITIGRSEFFTGRTQVAFTGKIEMPDRESAERDLWRYSVEAHDGLIGSVDVLEDPIGFDLLAFRGTFDVASGEFILDKGELRGPEGQLSMVGRAARGEHSPSIQLNGEMQALSIRALKMIWPQFAAPGAHEWVTANIKSGRISRATFDVDFAPGQLARIEKGESIPTDSLLFEFDMRDLVFSYLDEMPYIRGADGKAAIRGDEFRLKVERAHVDLPSGGRLAIPGGSFYIPKIAADDPLGTIKVNLRGGLAGLLELLDHEPLGYPSDIGLSYRDFEGGGDVALRLDLPLIDDVKLEQVKIRAESEINKFATRKPFSGRRIEDGVLLLKVENEVVSASGEVLINKFPAQIVWRLPFEETAKDPARFFVRMTLDDEERKKFGINLPYARGPVQFEFEPAGAFGAEEAGRAVTRVRADMKAARITDTPFGWSKPAGVAGDLRLEYSETGAGQTVLDELAYDGDGAKIRGRVVLTKDGDIQSIRLPQFNLKAGDNASLAVDRVKGGQLKVGLQGEAFNVSDIIAASIGLSGEAEAGPANPVDLANGQRVVVQAKIKRANGAGGVYLADASANLVTIDGWVSALDVVGRLNGRDPFKGTIQRQGKSGRRTLRVDAADAGAVFRMADIYKNAEGGTLVLLADMPFDPGVATSGLLKVSDFRLRGDEVLTTIDSAARRNAKTGQNGAGEGGQPSTSVQFSRLRVPFQRQPGMLIVGDSVLRGATIGATMAGTVDFNKSQINLNGTFIPVYALNNILGRVPVLGQVLVGGKDEGLLAMNFAVTGSTSDPRVTVNPLSVATPGILRKVFFDSSRSPAVAGSEGGGAANTGSINELPSRPVTTR